MTAAQSNINKLIDHLFRRESGKMIAVLTRIFGTENLTLVEDVVQDTLVSAFEQWPFKGIPQNPSAWLFSVARNKAIDALRRQNRQVLMDDGQHTERLISSLQGAESPDLREEKLIKDDMLRMMFACCHPDISPQNQVTLILKCLCGFSTAEIARAFMLPEDTISKRLYRTKEFFRTAKIGLIIPSASELEERTNTVLRAVYLLFNEGYNSTHHHNLIRMDLLAEALVLGKLLLENKQTRLPETYALLGLMCFHAARVDSRTTAKGDIILLADQDRSLWNRDLINEGKHWMSKAAFGDKLTAYHLEASIAYEHCAAPDFEHTNWRRILDYYDFLVHINSTPFTWINRTVAILYAIGPEEALDALNDLETAFAVIKNNYLYYSVLAEVYLQLEDKLLAASALNKAISLTKSNAELTFLSKKLTNL